jgi:hypothetical protein
MGVEAGALTVAGQWRNFTAFPSILANSIIINRLIFTSGLRRVNSTNSVPENEGGPLARKVVPLVRYCKTPPGRKLLPIRLLGAATSNVTSQCSPFQIRICRHAEMRMHRERYFRVEILLYIAIQSEAMSRCAVCKSRFPEQTNWLYENLAFDRLVQSFFNLRDKRAAVNPAGSGYPKGETYIFCALRSQFN